MVSLSKFSHLIATVFGLGTISWIPAPGTVASLLSILLWYLLNKLFVWKIWFYLLVFFVCLGCYVCHKTNQNIVVHDHPCIILDEFIGMWCVLILSPDISCDNNWSVLIGFLLFRIFDIVKPWPICFIDKNIKSGIGIVFDDLVAAFISIFFIFLLYHICF